MVLLSPNLLGSDNNIDQKSETVSAGANSEILNIFAAYTCTCIYHNPLMFDPLVALQSLSLSPSQFIPGEFHIFSAKCHRGPSDIC